jgi:hypothetical protein
LTIENQVSIILQMLKFISSFFFNNYKEELMKPANEQPLKDLKSNKLFQRKLGSADFKVKLKDQRSIRQRIGLNANAGHVRGGHSFH